jgi:hypothetical protein
MTRSTPFRFSLFEISFAILAALALMLSPQAALAQHGGGHAGGRGHIGGGGGHFGGSAGFGRAGHSYAGSHVSSSPVHVFSGPRSARVATNQPRSSNISAAPSGSLPRGLGIFAEPRGSGEAELDARRAAPLHTTIGFPPSTDSRFVSIASAHRGAPLMFSGQGQQVWQSSPDAAANRNSARITETRTPQRVFPKPPHMRRRLPILAGPGLFFPPAFEFSSPIFGLYGPGFGCGPSWVFPFQCNGLYPGVYGGYSNLGFGGGYGPYFGGFGDDGYGYDGGYYAPPSFDLTTPNSDEGASEEPAPSEWQNPPADNSSAESEQQAPAPDTVIYLKDGTSFAVKDYWVADGKLHYVTSYGGENAVDLGNFDLERTTDENAKQGIAITLRPAPESQPPASP